MTNLFVDLSTQHVVDNSRGSTYEVRHYLIRSMARIRQLSGEGGWPHARVSQIYSSQYVDAERFLDGRRRQILQAPLPHTEER